MEFLASYDFEIQYTPGKGNVVANALSRRYATLNAMKEWKQLEFLSQFNIQPPEMEAQGFLAVMEVRPILLGRIEERQKEDAKILDILDKLERGEPFPHDGRYSVDKKGCLRRDGRLCVPVLNDILEEVLAESHLSRMTIHSGGDKMYRDMKRIFYGPGMKKKVAEYVAACLTCQRVKAEQGKPGGLLLPLEIPTWKWEQISMDFIDGLPRSRKGNESIWIIVDRLTKSAHFIPIRSNRTAASLAHLYVKEIIRLHGVPSSIVSDRDPLFTSEFWRSLQDALGTELNLSTAYHPQTDARQKE